MYRPSALLGLLAVLAATLSSGANASVILPPSLAAKSATTSFNARTLSTSRDVALSRRNRMSKATRSGRTDGLPLAMAIPGYGIAEQVFVGGFGNFLQIYNYVITARILLSWFPQAQGIGALQPVFAITDPYLNLFRGIIPPVFGLDLSPILAFFTLNVLTTTTASIGKELPPVKVGGGGTSMKNKTIKRGFFGIRLMN